MWTHSLPISLFFFFNDTATTEIYTLSLHDALPISLPGRDAVVRGGDDDDRRKRGGRSEEHTSELQSPDHLVCRLLLEKKKKKKSKQLTINNMIGSENEVLLIEYAREQQHKIVRLTA